jgi:monofunctional glycosyltransferase
MEVVKTTVKSKLLAIWTSIVIQIKTNGFKFLKYFILGFFGLSILSAIVFKFIPVPITPLMIIRTSEQLFDKDKEMKLVKDWVSIKNISKSMQLAVVCAEDQKYLDHFGFDVEAIKSVLDKKNTKKRVRGASTISQQTAKNVFLWPGRSWIRKGLEVYFTLLIETFWSKKRILEVYLNIIEVGDGIYGVQAASQVYFKKDALQLTKPEAALIAATLPNPRKYSVQKPSSYIRGRKNWIMRQMSYWGNNFDFSKKEENNKQQTTKPKRK